MQDYEEEDLEEKDEDNTSGEYAQAIGTYNPDVTKAKGVTRLAAYNTYYKQMRDGLEDEQNGRLLQVDAAYRIYSLRLWKTQGYTSVDGWLAEMQSEGLLNFGKTKFYEIMSAIETSIGAGMEKDKAIRLGATHSSAINQMKVLGAIEVSVEKTDKRRPRIPASSLTGEGQSLLGNGVESLGAYIEELSYQTPADAWKTVRADMKANSVWIQTCVPYKNETYFDETGATVLALEVCVSSDSNGVTPYNVKMVIEAGSQEVVDFMRGRVSPKIGGKIIRSLSDV